jgi:hypothetical protein
LEKSAWGSDLLETLKIHWNDAKIDAIASVGISTRGRVMSHRVVACFAALLLFFGTAASAAELFYMDHDLLTGKYVGPVGPLVISGEIVPGDYDRLLTRILNDEPRFMAQNKIILASNGGDVREAIKIAVLIKALFTEISVGPQTGRCVGACFLIYVSAGQRATDSEHLIGVHRPTLVESVSAGLSPADAAALENRALEQVRAFLLGSDVPASLVEEMFRRAAGDVYWLSEADEKSLGYKSPSFEKYLAAKCAWDDALERDAYSGKRPFRDLTDMYACRARLTQPAALKALDAARKERAARGAERAPN